MFYRKDFEITSLGVQKYAVKILRSIYIRIFQTYFSILLDPLMMFEVQIQH